MSSLMSQVKGAARQALAYFPDRCSIISIASTPDGFGGSTDVETIQASGVRCVVAPLSQPKQIQIAGQGLSDLSHQLVLEMTTATKAIKPHYTIVVAATDEHAEMTFRNPVPLGGSYNPYVLLEAQLTV